MLKLKRVQARQAFDDVRIVYLWNTEHDFGVYAAIYETRRNSKSKNTKAFSPFSRFVDFYYQYRNHFFDEKDEIEKAAGRKPVNCKSKESAAMLNTAIIAYFTRHLPQIRQSLQALGFEGSFWDTLSTPEAMGWLMDCNNIYRKSADNVAHESGPGDVVSAVKSLRTGITDTVVRNYFDACEDIYPKVHAYVHAVIKKD